MTFQALFNMELSLTLLVLLTTTVLMVVLITEEDYSPSSLDVKQGSMPRRDWNKTSAHTQQPHHRRMRSGAKGKGHDSYLRMAKREISQAKAAAWKAALDRRGKEREREHGTVASKTRR